MIVRAQQVSGRAISKAMMSLLMSIDLACRRGDDGGSESETLLSTEDCVHRAEKRGASSGAVPVAWMRTITR